MVDDTFYKLQPPSLYLSRLGYSVSKATTKIDALNKLYVHSPDLVFINLLSSNASIDLCQALLQKVYTQNIPLVVADHNNSHEHLQTQQQGTVVLLPKHFGLHDLHWSIDFALKISQTRAETTNEKKVTTEVLIQILNHLQTQSGMVLGSSLTARYLEASRPACTWLKQVQIQAPSASFANQSKVLLNHLQVMASKQWVSKFIQQCSQIIIDFPKMLDYSLLSQLDLQGI